MDWLAYEIKLGTSIVFLSTVYFTPCNDQSSLLEYESEDSKEPFQLLFHSDRVTSSSFIPSHPPSEVRMSGNGWCAQSMCTVGSESQEYLQVDFGAEVVVEAIAIASVDESFYVTKYYVKYGLGVDHLYCAISEESNETIFDGIRAVDICRGNQDAEVKNFIYPVIAQFVRIIPVEWEGGVSPCLRMELYGCYVKECNQTNMIPVDFSSVSFSSNMDLWCTDSLLPYVTVTFTEPVYLLYAVIRGNGLNDVTSFLLLYENSSGARVRYVNVDGIDLFGEQYDSDDRRNILLWTPINTSQIQLIEHSDISSFSCVGVNFYGCTYSEVIDHEFSMLEATTEAVNPTSCVIRPVKQQTSTVHISAITTTHQSSCGCYDQQQTSVITVTTTVHISATTTTPQSSCGCSDQQQTSVITVTTTVQILATTTTPQSSCGCSGQQQTSASSFSVSNVLIITVPVVVLSGVIIVIVIVVIGILIWRKTKHRSNTLPYDKVTPATATVVNDLYGMGMALKSKSLENNNETSDNGVQDDGKNSVKYEYATITQPSQPTITYETVSFHEEDGTRSSNKAAASNGYSEPGGLHSDPEL